MLSIINHRRQSAVEGNETILQRTMSLTMIATIAMRKQLNTISVDQGKGGNESIIMQLHLRGYCTNNETNKKTRASIANKIAQSRVSGLHEQISFGEWLTTLALRLTLRPKSPGVKRTHDRTHARVRTHILYAKDLTRMAKWLQCLCVCAR